MTEPTCSQRDAASVIFNLSDYHVIDAIDLPLGGQRVIVKADTIADGCPDESPRRVWRLQILGRLESCQATRTSVARLG